MRAYVGYPEYQGFFFSRVWRESSVLAEDTSHERRSREKNERDSIKT